jgi:crotonobetainyl-CoA:carnitine CoA-transferase CaiB-like acyl-CoA transferase
MTIACNAPVIGADTVEVLQRVAGLSTQEIDALAAAGVIEIAARKRC